MTRSELIQFVREQRWAVGTSVDGRGAPQSAVVGAATTDRLGGVFDTRSASRNAANLRASPRIALVTGWGDGSIVQIDGPVDEPGGDELFRLKDLFLQRFPDGCERCAGGRCPLSRRSGVDLPQRLRSTPPTVIVFDADGLQRSFDARDAQ